MHTHIFLWIPLLHFSAQVSVPFIVNPTSAEVRLWRIPFYLFHYMKVPLCLKVFYFLVKIAIYSPPNTHTHTLLGSVIFGNLLYFISMYKPHSFLKTMCSLSSLSFCCTLPPFALGICFFQEFDLVGGESNLKIASLFLLISRLTEWKMYLHDRSLQIYPSPLPLLPYLPLPHLVFFMPLNLLASRNTVMSLEPSPRMDIHFLSQWDLPRMQNVEPG